MHFVTFLFSVFNVLENFISVKNVYFNIFYFQFKC